ncbi:ferritin-like domain-containing protein [Winogradskyella luteola]|uniref:PA2169 family four-helix-bundle protein n=1 Tax=Winogradskyella luteola TaxID=2828330 RepID=A0A9X1F9M4_9FLAO|nr:PA2169 family four-helix-bundle protein [Winogradskyella luteola]MBV7268938.1 PA2169 family four-helix-bundle protein [Winogradskyella luteola]
MKYEKEISNKLNELIEKNINAKDGYARAIEKVDNSEIKRFFKSRAEERAEFVKELRSEVWNNGEIPENSGNITGELHRNWMSLKSLFSSNDEEAMLNETIRGEKSSLEEYNEILSNTTLPLNISNLLRKQRNTIEATIKEAENYEVVMS